MSATANALNGLSGPSAKRWVQGFRMRRLSGAGAALRAFENYTLPPPFVKLLAEHSRIAIQTETVPTGKAFNIFGLSLLTRMLALQCDLEAGEVVWQGGDVHLYLNHAHLVEEQLSRSPQGAPRLRILRRPATIFDHDISDFAVEDYAPQASIAAPVAV